MLCFAGLGFDVAVVCVIAWFGWLMVFACEFGFGCLGMINSVGSLASICR